MTRAINYYCRLFYKLTSPFYKLAVNKRLDALQNGYIVSLTTFPPRINKVWITIESIIHQSKKPDAIILWLSNEEFSDSSVLPKKLLKLQKRGLEIRFCSGNLMPHKKYFYAMQEYPKANIITIDDDMIYPPNLLHMLIKTHLQYPLAICCSITREITIINKHIAPYNEWKYVRHNTLPSFKYLTIGVGGTLFPANSLNKQAFNQEEIQKRAIRADDLWLKVMSLLNQTPVISISGEFSRFFPPIIIRDNKRLMDENIGQGKNDLIFNELMKHYHISYSVLESQ
ncbi:hypothetical protein [Microbacter margulisiae]|uniref:Glycosyl transferase family 2 n=1 Tax=Microbacter margulisiae TaxID=1350067 RepID=A0A7W5DNV7_9PORP|nr:hypothetical protein [Microbacter margulisiae]MBB3185993.1 hypothetical protein [Microbacter margulisiae]